MTDRSNRIVAVSPQEQASTPFRLPPRDDVVDLRPHLTVLWQFRFVILVVVLLTGAAAFFAAVNEQRIYEATAILSVSASKLTDGTTTVGTANFRPVVENRGVAQKLVQQFHLDGAPYFYTGASFLDNATQLDEIRNTGLMRVSVRLRDPQLTANVANALAAAAVDYSRTLGERDVISLRDLTKQQLDQAAARLRQASAALSEFNTNAKLDLARADVDALVEQRKSVPAVLSQIAAKRAAIAAADRELASRSKVDVTSKNVTDDTAMVEAVKAARPGGTPPLALNMKSESVNKTYENIDRSMAEDRVELAALERQLRQLTRVEHPDAAALTTIRKYHEDQAERERLEVERTGAEQAYLDASTKYEGARLQVAEHIPDLQVIDPAVVPSRPVSREVVSRTVTASVGALGVSVLCALLVGLWRTHRSRAF